MTGLQKRVYLGQPTDTKIITASHSQLRSLPTLLSLGDVLRRPPLGAIFKGDIREKLGLSGPLMVDSGGFTLARVKRPDWSPHRVIEIYRNLAADVLVSLDYPPLQQDCSETRLSKIARSAEAFRIMQHSLNGRIVPVIHGRTLIEVEESLRRTARAAPVGRMVGIGGLVPLLQQSGRRAEVRKFIINAVRLVADFFPKSAVHVFGAGSPQTIGAVFMAGARSVDSLAWRTAAAFGSIYLVGGVQRLLPGSKRLNGSRPVLTTPEQNELLGCACPACTSVGRNRRMIELARSFHHRAIHNAWTVSETFGAYSFRPDNALRVELRPEWLSALAA